MLKHDAPVPRPGDLQVSDREKKKILLRSINCGPGWHVSMKKDSDKSPSPIFLSALGGNIPCPAQEINALRKIALSDTSG
jgi:hypothetical protein